MGEPIKFINPGEKILYLYGRKYDFSLEEYGQMNSVIRNMLYEDLIREMKSKGFEPYGEPNSSDGDDFVTDEETGETYRFKFINVYCTYWKGEVSV